MIIFILIAVSITHAFSKTPASFEQVDKILHEMSIDVDTKTLNPDLAEKQLKNVLILEESDPSRSCLYIIMNSYLKNKDIYKKAIERFNRKDQKTLKELMKLIEDFDRNGNG